MSASILRSPSGSESFAMTEKDKAAIRQQLSSNRIEKFRRLLLGDCPESFVSVKTATAIPAVQGLVTDALIQATLDPRVRAIEFQPSAVLGLQTIDLDAIVLVRNDGRFHLDVVAARRLRTLEQEDLFLLALQDLGLTSIVMTSEDIQSQPRFSNSRLVWRYRGYPVPVGLRIQVMQHLARGGPTLLGRLLEEIRGESDPGAALFAMACANLVEIDLQEQPVGPETRVASPFMTQGHSHATEPVNLADEDQADVDLPQSEETPIDWRVSAGPKLPTADDVLLQAVFESALDKRLRRRLAEGDRLAVVVRVPSPSWVKAVNNYFLATFNGKKWSSFARDGSDRIRDKSSTGNNEVASALSCGRCAVGIAAATDILPAALTTAADMSIRIPPPDAKVLRRALRLFCGSATKLTIGDDVCAGLDFYDIVCAFRSGSDAAAVIWRLASASRKITGTVAERLPSLETAFEYGEFRTWGLELARDLDDYRAGRIPWSALSRGLVLHGESGLGKSWGVRLLAQACRVPLIVTSVSDLFANSGDHLDEVIKASRAVFARAAAVAPVIVFFDEIDALPNRATLSGRNASFWRPVINDFLLSLDSAIAGQREGVIVIGATNFLAGVDTALLRPGRLERAIELVRPDHAGTANILSHHLAGALTDAEISEAAYLAERSTGAEIMRVVRDARRIARQARRRLRLDDLISVMAPKDDVPANKLFRICAHEAGHAIASLAVPWGALKTCVIAGRDGGLGRTVIVPDEGDLVTRRTVEDHVTVLLSGRAAERILRGAESTGAGQDDASDLAFGTRLIAGLHVSAGLGRSVSYLSHYRDGLELVRRDRTIRREVERDMSRLQTRALDTITANRQALLAVTEELVERRHMSGDAIRAVFATYGTSFAKTL
jgi:cell division protease FtsH